MLTKHHQWFPKKWYRSQMEMDFRNLCCHISLIDDREHQALHRVTPPPEKPTRAEMYDTIVRHIRRCVGCHTRLRHRPYLHDRGRRRTP